MRMKSKRGRGLILGVVNVAVLLGAALIIQSRASSSGAPSHSSSFSIRDEPELAFTRTPRAAVASSSAPVKATGTSDRSASVAGPSISSVPAADDGVPEQESLLDEIWYAESSSAYAALPSLSDESSSWPGLGGSPVTPWGTAQPTSLGGSSSRYAGGFGGGSPGAGMGGGPAGSRSDSTNPAATTSALRSSLGSPTAAVAGGPAGSMQANANLQGNLSFPLLQLPGNGPGGSGPPGLASTNLTTQSTVTTLQTPVSVPEPGSVLLLGTAMTLAAAYRSRRRQKK